jgi:hypothetical protein
VPNIYEKIKSLPSFLTLCYYTNHGRRKMGRWGQTNKISQKIKNYSRINIFHCGIIIIASQVVPLTKSYIQGKWEEFKINIMSSPVPDSYKNYIEDEFAYYEPGLSYFQNLAKKAGIANTGLAYSYDPVTKEKKEIIIDIEYSEPMYLSIEAIGIKMLK